MYSALTVANCIIDYCNNKRRGISNLKLQKILYFVQAEFLISKLDHSACFYDRIEAWDFGPVVPSVYHEYKIYGSAIIPFGSGPTPGDEIAPDDYAMILEVVEQILPYSASQLVEFTHAQDPWKNAYVHGLNGIISNDSIRAYFES